MPSNPMLLKNILKQRFYIRDHFVFVWIIYLLFEAGWRAAAAAAACSKAFHLQITRK